MTLHYSRTLLTCQVILLALPIVSINEVAWIGTQNSANDEWIELYNNTAFPINLDGWVLKATDGTPEVKLARSILANGFYLLERTDDNTVPGIAADQIYTGALENSGEKLELYDSLGSLVDFIDGSLGWPAGDNTTKQTMERKDANAWQTSKDPGGTPKAQNSEVVENNSPPTEEFSAKPRLTETKPNPVEEKAEKETAAVGEQATGPVSLFVFLVAAALAAFSGIIVLVLKKGLK